MNNTIILSQQRAKNGFETKEKWQMWLFTVKALKNKAEFTFSTSCMLYKSL